MAIEEDEGAREDVVALQMAMDLLPTVNIAKRLETLGNMKLMLTRLKIMVDDEISSLRHR